MSAHEPSDSPTPLGLPTAHPPLGDRQVRAYDFHLREWAVLRREGDAHLRELHRIEVATLLGLGAFLAWFASTSPPKILLVLPSLLVALAGTRLWSTLVRLQEIGTYTRTIESNLALGVRELVGWQHTRDVKFPLSTPFRTSATAIWWMTTAALALAWLVL